jgi:LmbE family N-acetylglucosaminyl deacetylase
LRVLHGRIQRLLATDITLDVERRSTLVVAPHPDDETLGCGGTIARITSAQTPVHVVVISDGRGGGLPHGTPVGEFVARREDECRAACSRLGIAPNAVEFLGFEDARLTRFTDDIVRELRRVVNTVEPEQIIIPLQIDAHPDHRAVGDALRTMLDRRLVNTHVLAYPIWFWNRWAWTKPDASKLRQLTELTWRPLLMTTSRRWCKVCVSDQLAAKCAALSAHASQLDGVLNRDWLEQFLSPEELFFCTSGGRSTQ